MRAQEELRVNAKKKQSGFFFINAIFSFFRNPSYLAQTASNGDLGLSVIVQSPSYRWNVRITQIKCSDVRKLYLP